MTIPEHIREEAEACYLHCEQMDSYGIIETIATALLAAEQRGMERAAEIAEEEQQGQRMMKAQAGAQNDRKASRDHESMAMCAGFIAAAIRKAKEQLK